MKKPSFDQVSLTILVIVGSLGFFTSWYSEKSKPEPERYIDYCGDSVVKELDAMQREGITPLLLPDEDVPKYENQDSWIRPATVEELQIQLRRFGQRELEGGHQLWIVAADAPPLTHALARQYQCLLEELLEAEAAAHDPGDYTRRP
jgi:hypothetical protein